MSESRLWCPDPAAAAQACAAQYPQTRAHTLEIADEICQHIFTFRDHWEMERVRTPVAFGAEVSSIDWALIPFGDPEWVYAMNRHTSFVNLAKAWLYTGKSIYADTFAELVDDWISRVPLTEQSSAGTWRSLEAGLRAANWLRVLRLFHGSSILTPERQKRMENCLSVHGEYLASAFHDFHRLSNWGVLQDHGLYLLGLHLNREDWCTLAAERIAQNLHLSVFADGSHWEQSPLYHCEVLQCVLDVLWAAKQNNRTLPAEISEKAHAMCRALRIWLKPNGHLLLQSDSDDVDARDLLVSGALLFQDASLCPEGISTLCAENLWDLGVEQQTAYSALLSSAQPLHSSRMLPDSGNCMLRGDEDSYVHMHCGCLGSGHGHADLLHVDAGIAGEDVLIDSGRYTYVNTPLRQELKSPAAHNTTRVDDLDFSTCLDSWGYSALAIPVKGEHRFTESADYVSGAHLGYLKQGLLPMRKLVFLKELNVLLLFDQLFGEGCHTFEQNFHFGEGEVTLEGSTVFWKGQHACAALQCLGNNAQFLLHPAPYSREYNTLLEGSALTVKRTAEHFNWFVTALHLMPDACTAPMHAELLPVSKLRAGVSLTDAQAQAVRVTVGEKTCVVLICHSEVISEVDLLSAGGYSGYGKVLLFDPAHPHGLCLAW